MRWLLALALASCATPRDPVPTVPPALAEAAFSVDAELGKLQAEAKVTPAPPASDAAFLRRLLLDLTGEVPSPDEVRAYETSVDPGKKRALVERVVASPAFARHWATRLSVLLVGREARPPVQKALGGYLERSLAEHARWDRMASELLASTDAVSDSGASAYLVHQLVDGGLEKATGATAKVFLGLQIACAQCHDHPLDSRWKQADFWAMAGFFARTRIERSGPGPEGRRLGEKRRGEAMLPSMSGMGGEPVAPKFLGREVAQVPPESRRETFARAVVASDLFAKEAVNRTWAALFGRGLVEPVDDLGAEQDPAHPRLLVELAKRFREGGFDLRALVRDLVLTDAWARASTGGTGPADAVERTFARAAVRTLPPETLVSALLSMTALDDAIAAKRGEETARRRAEREIRQYVYVSGDDEMTEVDTFEGSVPQALLLANGELTNQGTRALAGGRVRAVIDATKDRDERIDRLFLAAFARRPEAEERAAAKALVEAGGGRAEAYEDLFHALVTSIEATTNH